MDKNEILSYVDHTLLKQDATWEQIKQVCDDAVEFKCASVCIPPCYVKQASEYMKDVVPVCTVIGFPNGNMTTASKVFETKDAIANGAKEIDMVINIGDLKAKKYDAILNEINEIKKACGDLILKVIIETCLLTKDEIVKMCEIVNESNADFIKTSTGFSTNGATFEDVELMVKHSTKKVKAAGGIKSIEDAEKFIELGASRLGTSRLIKLVLEKK